VVSTGSLLAFAVTAFALIVVPGPSVLFVISRGVALGGRAAVATVIGNAHRRTLASVLDAATAPRGTRRILREGYVVGITNPKAAVFMAAVLPQFTDPARGHVPIQLLLLGLVFVGIALVSDSIWGLAAGFTRGWLGRSPERLEALGGLGGLVMIGLGVRLALVGRRD
jgi:threonine/homoserine/homoserine lactone efflux protein